ncbi:MAG: hypothetical protein RL095_1773 [Verrucomicrobiota bacterium]
MNKIIRFIDALNTCEGAHKVNDLWGHHLPFEGICDIWHYMFNFQGELNLIALCMTNESDDFNLCHPTKLNIKFSGVSLLYYCGDNDFKEISIDAIMKEINKINININNELFVSCAKMEIVSCEKHEFD